MKTFLYFIPVIFLFAAACRKNYTCDCSVQYVSNTYTTPRNGSAVIAMSSQSSAHTKNLHPGVRKNDLHRQYDCNTRQVVSTQTYTASGDYGSTTASVADVLQIDTNKYDCKIK